MPLMMIREAEWSLIVPCSQFSNVWFLSFRIVKAQFDCRTRATMGKKAKSKGKSFAPAGNVSNSTAVETPPGAPFPKEPTIFQAIEVGVDPKLLLRLIQQGEDVNAANVFRCGHLVF